MASLGVQISRLVSALCHQGRPASPGVVLTLLCAAVYLNDSVAGVVHKFDFDSHSGNITNKQLFIDRRAGSRDGYGEPDGMVAE